jgi:hypothetical protein
MSDVAEQLRGGDLKFYGAKFEAPPLPVVSDLG